MKRSLLAFSVCLAVLATSCVVAQTRVPQQPGSPEAAMSLAEAERAFARDASVRTVNEAFVAVVADSTLLFHPLPVLARAALAEHPMRANLSLVWTPTYAETSADGLWGFDLGPSEWGDRGKPPAQTGTFFSVWHRQNGIWQLETDCGILSPIPARPANATHLLVTRTSTKSFDDMGSLADVERWLIADYKGRFAQLADYDARVLRNGVMPTSTHADAIALVSRDSVVDQSPSRVVVAGSGDLGYVAGTINANSKESRGYERVYRRAADGSWKIAVDCRP
jgi:hypothetical protein